MDVSDRRLLVQRMREAKIAPDFSLIRAIFCVCRLCLRSGAARAIAPPLRLLKTQKESAEGPKPFRALTVPGQSQPVLTIWKTGKTPRVRRERGLFCVGESHFPKRKLERGGEPEAQNPQDSAVSPGAKLPRPPLKICAVAPGRGDPPSANLSKILLGQAAARSPCPAPAAQPLLSRQAP